MTEPLISELDEKSFDSETFDSSEPVLVFFGAEARCAVCRNLYPIVEKVAETYTGRLKVKMVDVDRYPNLAVRFRLKGIPVLLLFKEGLVEGRLAGFHERPVIDSFVGEYLT